MLFYYKVVSSNQYLFELLRVRQVCLFPGEQNMGNFLTRPIKYFTANILQLQEMSRKAKNDLKHFT